MGELLKKPYEISVWEDRLVTEDNISYYKEVKLAVIGSDKMTSPNRAYDPVLTENVNGEKTLTFNLAYKYYDVVYGKRVDNPFYPYLINERKIKLHYNDEWFEFILKECSESSEDYTFTYTARELFSLELAKGGYNVVLDQSLNNNQGTVTELGEKVLEGTDWKVDKENSDLLVQYIQEPLYKATVGIEDTYNVYSLDEKKPVPLENGETIYIFYSYIKNKTVENVQFIRKKDFTDKTVYMVDDDNVIKSPNYRFQSNITYKLDEESGEPTAIDGVATIDSLYYEHQGYRAVYGIQTTYDPVENRTVDVYRVNYDDGAQDVYHYMDYDYSTSDVVTSYITNGSNFNIFDNGDIQGWYRTTTVSKAEGKDYPVLQPMSLTTYPEVSSSVALKALDNFPDVTGYMELKFNGILGNKYENTYFNKGFEDNSSMIDHISRGEKFVLRLRYSSSDKQHGTLRGETPIGANKGLRVLVAKYETIEYECYLSEKNTATSKVRAYRPTDIVLDFNGEFKASENQIRSGHFGSSNNNKESGNYDQYIVDNVVQTPSTLYVYYEGDSKQGYIWDGTNRVYVKKPENYGDYYLTTARALTSFSNETMAQPDFNLGIFLYTKDTELIGRYIYLQDIQLTRYFEAKNEATGEMEPVTLGNVPSAVINEIHNYYLKPAVTMKENEVTTYDSLKYLAFELGVNEEDIKPVFNEDCEKILSIQASNSNYFDILQNLCETFECWLDIRVEHNEDGSITLDKDKNPIKRVAFKEYAGKDNFSGFRNGINLDSIERTIDSNEIVTKLIVEPVQSEYTGTGSVDIQSAPSNPSGQSYIINLSYFLNTGIIPADNVKACNEDLISFYSTLKKYNDEIARLSKLQGQVENSLTNAISTRNVYSALINEAEEKYNKAIAEFEEITNMSYDEFIHTYNSVDEFIEEQEKESEEESEEPTGDSTEEPTEEPNEDSEEGSEEGSEEDSEEDSEDESEDEDSKDDSKTKTKSLVDNDTVVELIGTIYTSLATMNNYSGLLTNQNEICKELDLQCNGAKEIGVTVTYTPGVEQELNPSTQVVFEDYISGIDFRLRDSEGGEVLYQTTPNDRVFNVTNASTYVDLTFLHLPTHYNLRYFESNEPYVIKGNSVATKSFEISDTVEGKSYSRHFKIVPDEDYLKDHEGYDKQIERQIKLKEEAEKEFYRKYSRFLQEGTWSSQDYIDPELYYQDALQVSNTSAQPQVSYTINVLEVSQLEGLSGYDFRVGDKTYIEDTEFFGYQYDSIIVSEGQTLPNGTTIEPNIIEVKTPIREEVIVSEIEWHLDEPDSNTITIQNYKTRFEDLFQRISATVQAVQRNEITYPKTTSILDQSGLINSNLLANSLNGIGGTGFALTTNGSVAATNDGFIIRDLTNSANVMKLASGGLQVSTDGGANWGTAISAEGISTDVLTAGTINTQRIWLMDGNNPSFRWDKAGLNAYGLDENGNSAYDLKTYVRFDKYGLYGIKNDEDYVASSLDDVRNKAFFGITWDGFFIKNSYTDNGEVSITSEDDIVVKKGDVKRIHIGAVEKDASGAPTEYGIKIRNDNGDVVFETGDDGNLAVTGAINALTGNFSGEVTVGSSDSNHIIIDGTPDNPTIKTSNYSEGNGLGWIIDGNGDASFANVSVRGAIKTAVFEYEEIQAVGGAFIFRPSSTIKEAYYTPIDGTIVDEDTGEVVPIDYKSSEGVYQDLYVVVEKPLLFREGNWVKISNCNTMTGDPKADAAALGSYGLVHVYKVVELIKPPPFEPDADNPEAPEYDPQIYQETSIVLRLEGGTEVLDVAPLDTLAGGALIDFGEAKKKDGIDVPGDHNYGIGINSSDDYVSLPARAISLFETTIHPDDATKVTYNMRGILGTLPTLPADEVDDKIYNRQMAGTQGIYTDNMYLGDASEYLAFYTDGNGRKRLKIRASQLMFESSDVPEGEDPWKDVAEIEAEGIPGPAGKDAIYVAIDSTAGNFFQRGQVNTYLIAHVYRGSVDVTNQFNTFYWYRRLPNGEKDPSWSTEETSNLLEISTTDVDEKAVFVCEVAIS